MKSRVGNGGISLIVVQENGIQMCNSKCQANPIPQSEIGVFSSFRPTFAM